MSFGTISLSDSEIDSERDETDTHIPLEETSDVLGSNLPI